jgi:hypothetical protein
MACTFDFEFPPPYNSLEEEALLLQGRAYQICTIIGCILWWILTQHWSWCKRKAPPSFGLVSHVSPNGVALPSEVVLLVSR